MEKTDVTIIGAGIVGLAIASRISSSGTGVFVIEKNKSLIKKFKKHVAAFSVIPTNFNEEPWSEKEICIA